MNWLKKLTARLDTEMTTNGTQDGSSFKNGSNPDSTNFDQSNHRPQVVAYATSSGSVYQVDYTNKRVRRLQGNGPATDRQGPDGQWKSFEDVVETSDGALGFVWRVDTEPGRVVFRSTVTSPVVAQVELEVAP